MKKFLLTTALFLTVAVASLNASATLQEQTPVESAEIAITEVMVPVEIETQPSANEPYIPESEITRKMIQAEKARNAAENDGWGGAITIIAMCIVISALAVLSLLFFGFGKISEALMSHKKRQAKEAAMHDPEDYNEVDSGEVIAAIAMALSEHFDDSHDIEDTILTIRRMKKAYSPWNSKIYNMRNMPDHSRNAVSRSAF